MRPMLFVLSLFLAFSCASKKKPEATYPVGQIITPKGEMLFWLYDETPLHKASFIELAKAGYWDTLTFNRVVEGFVIQGGCPDTPEGFKYSPYLIEPEFHDHIKHEYGALGAGRDENPEKLSAGCQLYVVQDKNGIPRLDGNYMIFGKLFRGFNTLEIIARVETDETDTPVDPVSMDVNVIYMTARQLELYGILMNENMENHEKQ